MQDNELRTGPGESGLYNRIAVLRDGAGDESLVRELQDFVKARIAPYKYPRAIEFVTTLPRTETGKLQRFKLRTEVVR